MEGSEEQKPENPGLSSDEAKQKSLEWQNYDMPDDEDLSDLYLKGRTRRRDPKFLAIKGWIAVALLIAALSVQHSLHGPLFLTPEEEQIVVLYRTEVAHAFGMAPMRLSRKATYRIPFFEVTRLVRHSDLATTVVVTGSNAEQLEFPTQTISVIWSLDPNHLLDNSRRGLMAANGTELLVKQVTTLYAQRAMQSSSLKGGVLSQDAEGIQFEQTLRRALYDLGIRLESVTGMQFVVAQDLQNAYADLTKENGHLKRLADEKKKLVTQRTDALSKIKTDSEEAMAGLLAKHGDAMASLQDTIDQRSQLTESTITENRLTAETDRAIYRLQAQHLHEMYELKSASYRSFFEQNPRIHPALPRVTPESLRPSSSTQGTVREEKAQ